MNKLFLVISYTKVIVRGHPFLSLYIPFPSMHSLTLSLFLFFFPFFLSLFLHTWFEQWECDCLRLIQVLIQTLTLTLPYISHTTSHHMMALHFVYAFTLLAQFFIVLVSYCLFTFLYTCGQSCGYLSSHTVLAGKLFIHLLTEVVSHCTRSAASLVHHHVMHFYCLPTTPTLSHSVLLYSVTIPHYAPCITSSLVVSLSFGPSLPWEGGDLGFENF